MEEQKKLTEEGIRKIIMGILSEEIGIYNTGHYKNKLLQNIIICRMSSIKTHRHGYGHKEIIDRYECNADLVPIKYLELSSYLKKLCDSFSQSARNHIFIEDILVERQKRW